MTGRAQSDELMVFVLGRFAVCQAGRVLRPADVGSRKARMLLGMLAVHSGHLPVDRIAFGLWRDTPPRDPTANVATLVSRLRAVLGSGAIVGGGGDYRLADTVRVDLAMAADLVADAERQTRRKRPAAALAAARRAMELLDAGTVLAGEREAGGFESARAWHGRLLRRARQAIAGSALRVGDVRAAQDAAAAALTADAFDEVACRLLMRAYHAAGEPARALLAGDRLRASLATELGVDPAPATREVYLAILRDTAAQAAG